MAAPRKILIVDDDDRSRFLLAKTLLRKFPHLVLLECIHSEVAVTSVAFEQLDAVVVHRAMDVDGPHLVRTLRKMASGLPLVLVSNASTHAALAAGATRCLAGGAWLRVGSVIAELMAARGRDCA